MVSPIFIHPSTAFLERIKQESENKALTTPSMMEALKWLANPVQHVSGVYIQPDDVTFSALKFIEIALSHRPSLPIFLLEGKLAMNKSLAEKLSQRIHVRGIFSGTESYQTLISPLRINQVTDTTVPRIVVPEKMYPGHVAIPVTDFYIGTHYPYDLFIPTPDGQIRLFAKKGSEIDSDYLVILAEKSPVVLAKEEDVNHTKSVLKFTKENIASDEDFPASWRSSEVMASASDLLSEMRNSGVSDQLVHYASTMLTDLYTLISSMGSAEEGDLSDVIDRAKRCDRAVFCASYSMLVCKELKFEKNATLEILGFASVLQDIALFQTPFGNLAEKPVVQMNSQELQYYNQHPVLSSDLVSQHTDVPQVTLQVIRQHHERKNKTGFPNKVGGSQLHAMAEVLSLINSYYDLSHSALSPTEALQELVRKVFPAYSEHVVNAFKNVLGAILKDKIQAPTTPP